MFLAFSLFPCNAYSQRDQLCKSTLSVFLFNILVFNVVFFLLSLFSSKFSLSVTSKNLSFGQKSFV